MLTGLIPIWLYGLAAVLLLVRIGEHPPYAYNWENYTAWGMFRYWDDLAGRDDLFRMSDGLMTDSGEGPLMVHADLVGLEAVSGSGWRGCASRSF